MSRRVVDIRRELCPMTWVRVKLALEALPPGEELDVLLRGEEPLRNVPRSAAGEGHAVVIRRGTGDEHELRITKKC